MCSWFATTLPFKVKYRTENANIRYRSAEHPVLIPERSRPSFRDDLAHHSGMMSPESSVSASLVISLIPYKVVIIFLIRGNLSEGGDPHRRGL